MSLHQQKTERLLLLIAKAFQSSQGYFITHGSSDCLFSMNEMSKFKEIAHVNAKRLLSKYNSLGPDKAKQYLGSSITSLPHYKQLDRMVMRTLNGEVIEAMHEKLINRMNDLSCLSNDQDDMLDQNYFDHIIHFEDETFRAESKRIDFSNSNISWNEQRKIQTCINHCDPKIHKAEQIDFVFCAKSHLNLRIIAPIAIITAHDFYNYTEPSVKYKGPLFKHKKDAYIRTNKFVFVNKIMLARENELCNILDEQYNLDPNAYKIDF